MKKKEIKRSRWITENGQGPQGKRSSDCPSLLTQKSEMFEPPPLERDPTLRALFPETKTLFLDDCMLLSVCWLDKHYQILILVDGHVAPPNNIRKEKTHTPISTYYHQRPEGMEGGREGESARDASESERKQLDCARWDCRIKKGRERQQ